MIGKTQKSKPDPITFKQMSFFSKPEAPQTDPNNVLSYGLSTEAKDAGRPLKIAIISQADRTGGAESCASTLHLSLLKLGHQSHLYVGRKYTDLPNVREIAKVRAVPALLRLKYCLEGKQGWVQAVPGLLRLRYWLEYHLGWQYLYAPGFRQLRYLIDPDTDILHIHCLWGAYADIGALPALARRFPTVITLHDSWLLTGHCTYPYYPMRCTRWRTGCGRCPDLNAMPGILRDGTRFNWMRKFLALRRSDVHITTPSEWLRQKALLSPILAGKPVTVVPNNLDKTVFMPGSKAAARAKLGISPERFVIMLVAQDLEINTKGIPDGIEAIRRCVQYPLTALLVGKSSERVAKKIPVLSIVVPYQRSPENLASCYRAADVTVVPSHSEVFGMVAIESQACGTPVVAYASGGLSEAVKDDVGGILVPTGDISTLTAAIRRLADNPDERLRLGRQGADWAHKQFGSQQIAQAYIRQYRQVINKRMKDR